MNQSCPSTSPAAASPTRSAPIDTGRTHWTPARQRDFLITLAETGSVAAAARGVGMSRSSAHRLRARLVGTPFDRTWAEALRQHRLRLADPFETRLTAAPAAPERRAPVAGPARR